VRDFWRFVDENGYVTLAERPPDPASYPGADPAATSKFATAGCGRSWRAAADSPSSHRSG
jgi:hypothetical protein